jgi:hypothetical protein
LSASITHAEIEQEWTTLGLTFGRGSVLMQERPTWLIEKRHTQPYEDSISLPAPHASPCVTRNNAATPGREPGIFTDI